MDMQFRRGLSFVLCGLGLALTLACAMPGASGGSGGGQDVATTESVEAGAPSGGESRCEYPTTDFIDITGTYTVEGQLSNDLSPAYTGEVTFTRDVDNCFNAEWRIDGRTRTGYLQVMGNTVSGVWHEGDKSGNYAGTANKETGTLSTYWGSEGGVSSEYVEKLTKK